MSLKINNENWVLRCTDLTQRDELLAYAADNGVPCYKHNANTSALALGWYRDLMAYNDREDTAKEGEITPQDFRDMCDAYATANA